MTNKIEIYNEAKARAASVCSNIAFALGDNSPNNDKHTFRASFLKLANAPFAPMMISIDASFGYYGSSSAYSATSEPFGRYLAMAINQHKRLLCETAAKFANDEVEKARRAAADEARAILSETVAKED